MPYLAMTKKELIKMALNSMGKVLCVCECEREKEKSREKYRERSIPC